LAAHARIRTVHIMCSTTTRTQGGQLTGTVSVLRRRYPGTKTDCLSVHVRPSRFPTVLQRNDFSGAHQPKPVTDKADRASSILVLYYLSRIDWVEWLPFNGLLQGVSCWHHCIRLRGSRTACTGRVVHRAVDSLRDERSKPNWDRDIAWRPNV